MTWDLSSAKARLGIEDAAQDPAVTSAMTLAIAVAEGYCDRGLLRQDEAQEFTLPCGPSLLVRRYPLVSLASITPLDPQVEPPADPIAVPETWRIDKKRGIVYIVGVPPWVSAARLDAAPPTMFYEGTRAGFVLHYTGGYDPLPADLEAALWQIFDAVWYSTPGWGADPGSQSGAATGGALKSFNIDGMSLGFETASGGEAASKSGGDVGSFGPFLPLGATTLLHPYRAETLIGIG